MTNAEKFEETSMAKIKTISELSVGDTFNYNDDMQLISKEPCYIGVHAPSGYRCKNLRTGEEIILSMYTLAYPV